MSPRNEGEVNDILIKAALRPAEPQGDAPRHSTCNAHWISMCRDCQQAAEQRATQAELEMAAKHEPIGMKLDYKEWIECSCGWNKNASVVVGVMDGLWQQHIHLAAPPTAFVSQELHEKIIAVLKPYVSGVELGECANKVATLAAPPPLAANWCNFKGCDSTICPVHGEANRLAAFRALAEKWEALIEGPCPTDRAIGYATCVEQLRALIAEAEKGEL